MSLEEVVLVNQNGLETGTMEKIEAHKKGLLHRAFSVFIINSSGHLLLQRRASGKYHSPGLWTNTCCSHPRPGESVNEAARRRLKEEMGMDCSLTELFTFIYKTEFENGLTEHEFDHVLVGISDKDPVPDPDEVDEYEYAELEFLLVDIDKNPRDYTEWFKIAFPGVKDKLEQLLTNN